MTVVKVHMTRYPDDESGLCGVLARDRQPAPENRLPNCLGCLQSAFRWRMLREDVSTFTLPAWPAPDDDGQPDV